MRTCPICEVVMVKRDNEWPADFADRQTCGAPACAKAQRLRNMKANGSVRHNKKFQPSPIIERVKISETQRQRLENQQRELNAQAMRTCDRIMSEPLEMMKYRCPQAAWLLSGGY